MKNFNFIEYGTLWEEVHGKHNILWISRVIIKVKEKRWIERIIIFLQQKTQALIIWFSYFEKKFRNT